MKGKEPCLTGTSWPAGEEGSISNSEALDGLLRIGFSGGRKHKKTEAAETDSPETDPEEK